MNAKQYMTTAHSGQTKQKAHVRRVVAAMEREGYGEPYITVAWLHDTLWCGQGYAQGIEGLFGTDTAIIVCELVRHEDETYKDYILRVAGDPIAKVVKRFCVMDTLETLERKRVAVGTAAEWDKNRTIGNYRYALKKL